MEKKTKIKGELEYALFMRSPHAEYKTYPGFIAEIKLFVQKPAQT